MATLTLKKRIPTARSLTPAEHDTNLQDIEDAFAQSEAEIAQEIADMTQYVDDAVAALTASVDASIAALTVLVDENATAITDLDTKVVQEIGQVYAGGQHNISSTNDVTLPGNAVITKAKTYVVIVGLTFERSKPDGSPHGWYDLTVGGSPVGSSMRLGVDKGGGSGHYWSWSTGGSYIFSVSLPVGSHQVKVTRTSGTVGIEGASVAILG
jgi:hypothetical protein|tara:strand:- start:8007 stop:8639 length:633 start_codon:yes stop_codon:yes gene_type:complete